MSDHPESGTQYSTLLTGLLLIFILTGCANSRTSRIDARDDSSAIGEIKMVYNLDHVKEAASPHEGQAIELTITKTSGKADTSLASGQLPVIIDQATFTLPQQLKNEFSSTYWDLAWRHRFFYAAGFSNVGLNYSVGLGYSSVDITVTSATQHGSRRFESLGARLEIGLIYLLDAGSSVQANAMGYWAPLQSTAADSMSQVEVVYTKAFLRNFNFRAGYARWQAFGHDDQGYYVPRSDFRLELGGPIVALDMEF